MAARVSVNIESTHVEVKPHPADVGGAPADPVRARVAAQRREGAHREVGTILACHAAARQGN